jgi:hypothetical protein
LGVCDFNGLSLALVKESWCGSCPDRAVNKPWQLVQKMTKGKATNKVGIGQWQLYSMMINKVTKAKASLLVKAQQEKPLWHYPVKVFS